TVENTDHPNVEAHLLEETEDLYGEILRIEFKAFLRAEKKFCNTEELFLQIKKDGEQSKEVLEDQ
ncbi:MAG: riboflavin kinase, partial [Clostridia bacterium]|nr:riboflavin kinase [Clostridia bacterium]